MIDEAQLKVNIDTAHQYQDYAQSIYDIIGQIGKETIFSGNNYIHDGYIVKSPAIDKIIINGCGGTGGWFIPKLAKILYDASLKNKLANKVSVYFCDGDNVANKNLIRQNFIIRDIDKNKAEVLANRYAQLFPVNVDIVYVNKYITNAQILQAYPEIIQSKFVDIATLPFNDIDPVIHNNITLVLNFVDNAISRKCIHNYFASTHGQCSIVIDAGNNLYNGQVGVSLYGNRYHRSNSDAIFPGNYYVRNFAELYDNEFIKLENCADVDLAVNNPEQMFNVNDFSATITSNIVNNIFADSKIYYALTTFVTGKRLSVSNQFPFYGLPCQPNYNISTFECFVFNEIIGSGNTIRLKGGMDPYFVLNLRNIPADLKFVDQYKKIIDSPELDALCSTLVKDYLATGKINLIKFRRQYYEQLRNFKDFVDAKNLEGQEVQARAA